MANPLTPIGSAPILLSIVQAGATLGISRRTLFTLTSDGKLPSIRIGSRVLYDVADLRQFVDASKRTAPGAHDDTTTELLTSDTQRQGGRP